LLPVVKGWLSSFSSLPIFEENGGGQGGVLALIKPQFEAGCKESAKHKGVIRDPAVHTVILLDVLGFAQAQGFGVRGLLRSPVIGPKGNVEFLAWLALGFAETTDLAALVGQVLEE
jgi:23S rRNA (cytidine1920-2'-O)/16S rRNA (cytidine1409-2'-O)-methyltransferase